MASRMGRGPSAAVRATCLSVERRLSAVRYQDLIVEGSTARRAIVSTITDNFLGLGATFLHSLVTTLQNPELYDFILLQDESAAPLSAENRRLLTNICPRLVVLDIDTSGYLTEETVKRYDRDGNPTREGVDERVPSKKAVYLKLCVLRLARYEQVLLLDSDLLVLDDFSEIFTLPADVVCCRAGEDKKDYTVRFSPAGRTGPMFNSGVLLLSKACRGGDWFNRAAELVLAKRNTPLQDQSVFNMLLRDSATLYLPQTYNYKLDFRKANFLDKGEPLRSAKILHFIGPGKWALTDPRRRGQKIYDHYHAVQRETGAPFILQKSAVG